MDSIIAKEINNMKKNTKTVTKRVDNADGSYEETRIEQVSNGYIKTVTKHFKEGEDWKWEDVKSIHKEDPSEDLSLADKLEKFLKGE